MPRVPLRYSLGCRDDGCRDALGLGANFAAQESAGLSTSDLGGAPAASTGDPVRDYPHLTALFGAASGGAAAPVDNDAVFAAGVDALLFGILLRA
ncbi:hypothetical protein [Nocardia sp. MW-W600-9]